MMHFFVINPGNNEKSNQQRLSSLWRIRFPIMEYDYDIYIYRYIDRRICNYIDVYCVYIYILYKICNAG